MDQELCLKAPSYWEKVIRLLYPAKCMVCDDLLREDVRLYLCDNCYHKLPRYGGGFHKVPELPPVEGLFAAFRYAEGIDTSIHSMKYGHQPKLSRTIGFLLYEQLSKEKMIPDFDMIVPVPMHTRKKRQRGYNQSELIAKELSKYLNVPMRGDILMKTRFTKPQSTLKREERLQNMTDAFRIKNESEIKGNSILLVDDVVTTGTTLNTCAGILTEKGASYVFAAVMAIAEK